MDRGKKNLPRRCTEGDTCQGGEDDSIGQAEERPLEDVQLTKTGKQTHQRRHGPPAQRRVGAMALVHLSTFPPLEAAGWSLG